MYHILFHSFVRLCFSRFSQTVQVLKCRIHRFWKDDLSLSLSLNRYLHCHRDCKPSIPQTKTDKYEKKNYKMIHSEYECIFAKLTMSNNNNNLIINSQQQWASANIVENKECMSCN